uniref:Putative lipid-binding transport protein (Tim44 family) n=1 Tax=Kerstersia gyiorum TaxID=206506 RepID=A0A4Q7N1L5_9BURK|nr:TIM44-like domain-containing protein [Kerstersia gyiorum]MCO7635804.1 Tim44-like domain-containing protein [Pseudomonas sp. S 311-6]KAB0544947.1 Tim44 domain-containing protein [Kerstersia gyiorum]MCP1632202.1 putative lipid-binding transport protein (Tim44 family) [Kerstersia gyiorum]MCP1669782.1 putative lipid-binding transport protein (Tim44 family) [Kerstersia gyiorum]MCP1677919.1 putative lipid-binding transport protein (Tim44 family) [Kerstersia gyiorum]
MSRRFTKFCAAAVIALTGVAMVGASFDADARRMGGGGSFGRQSSNVMKQRQAVTPPAANTGANSARSAAAPAAAGAAAGAAATRSGMSRFLGPIAGIAAGLGLAALLSSMGLSGALLEFLSSALLIGLVVFAIMFIVRRLRGAGARPAMQGASAGAGAGTGGRGAQPAAPMWRESAQPAAAPAAAPVAAAAPAAAAAPVDPSWFIPADFDTHAFLQNAKSQFVAIQKLWDSGDVESLREYLTDDLLAELRSQITANAGGETSVVLLNAELLGVEQVSGGHLASVRFSGMLREEAGAEAFRFEEVWNLFKSADGGWMLAGIQQMNVDQQS